MGRPPTKPTKLKDGWYIEVRNKGSKSGIKIRKESLNEMDIAVEEDMVIMPVPAIMVVGVPEKL